MDYHRADDGEESGMPVSLDRQSRSTTWQRMLCSRCIQVPADLWPGSVLTVNIEILRVTGMNVAGTGTIAVDPGPQAATVSSDDNDRGGQRRAHAPQSVDASVNSGASRAP